MKRFYLLLIAMLLLISCATLLPAITPTSLPNATSESPNVLPETTDSSQPITAKVGETFEIVLNSNPTTGYRWNLVKELDTGTIQLVKQDYIAQQPILIGSGGVDVWTFHALKTGNAIIEFGHYPPGNTTEPAETVIFTINVE